MEQDIKNRVVDANLQKCKLNFQISLLKIRFLKNRKRALEVESVRKRGLESFRGT